MFLLCGFREAAHGPGLTVPLLCSKAAAAGQVLLTSSSLWFRPVCLLLLLLKTFVIALGPPDKLSRFPIMKSAD